MQKFKKILVCVVIFGLGAASGIYAYGSGFIDTFIKNDNSFFNGNNADDIDMSLFWTTWDLLEKDYFHADALDKEKMIYGSIKGLAESLGDPYTVFMDPSETTEFTSSLDSELEGIGAELTIEDDQLTVVTPLKNSPAEKAGILPGDIIFEINGKLASDMDFFDAILEIRGEPGTPVTLTVLRDSVEEPFELTIVRSHIEIDSVKKEIFDNGIAYIEINQFADKTVEEFDAAVSDLVLNKPKGIILDLRYNGGGYLDSAVDMLSYLIESDLAAVSIKTRNQENDETLYTSKNGKKILTVPLVVLVNGGSASASEIVAGAIQDHKRGVVIGTQTFGKGTVQEVEFLEDGSSLRLTMAEWLTPNQRQINKTGITPDILVEGDSEQLNRAEKYILDL